MLTDFDKGRLTYSGGIVEHDVVLQGTKCRDVSWHQVTGVHNIDNYVVLGEHWRGVLSGCMVSWGP